MKGLRRASCMIAAVVVAGALIPASASAADYFLKIDGIPGESNSVKYPDTIEVQSWSWGVSRDANKPATAQDFHFVKTVGPASPKLMEATAAGTFFPSAKLTAVRGAEQFPFLRYCFTGVRMTSFQSSGNSGSGALPQEQISFSYATVVNAFQGQDASGEATSPVFGGWDFMNKLRFSDTSC